MFGTAVGEALLLGLASGPACIASCGPVLVPSLLAEGPGFRISTRYLLAFLTSRLVGYLLFAALAWELGLFFSFRIPASALLLGLVNVGLALVLIRYAYQARKPCPRGQSAPQLVTIGPASTDRIPGAAILGLLTGVSLCPPFVAAGIRAAQLGNLAAAMIFFAAFFVGTSIWFIPFTGMAWIRRNEAVSTVARMAMGLIALYYFVVGVSTLLGRNAHVY